MKSGCLVAFAFLSSFLSCSTSAGEYAYTCEVRHVYSLQRDGSLRTEPKSELEKLMKESPFAVSRETGALTGNSAGLDTSLAKSTRIIKGGSEENSFEAVADFGDFKNGAHPYQIIEVEEFQKGPLKPFVLMGENGVVTGMCR